MSFKEDGDLHFKTNVLLKSIIGKDLITDDNIAVQELVKNSFDAGSRKCDLTFREIVPNASVSQYKKSNTSALIISDIGKGMSAYDLEHKWLNIAYSEKKAKRSEYNRTLAGNKGVGRFSCDRLGKNLTIYTKCRNENLLKLKIDWTRFEEVDDIDLNIQDISLRFVTIEPSQFELETGLKAFESGTVLFIESLREVWTHDKILSLRRELEKLINPNQSFKAEKFNINIEADEFKELDEQKEEHLRVNGPIENKIFEALSFKVTMIESKITQDGQHIITILKDRGRPIFTLVEKNSYELLKNVKTYIYYLNPYSKAYFKRQTGIRSVEFGSISLFINGFRIPPYGDAGDDWLGMENRKTQGQSRFLGTREVIGRIEVRDNVETLDDKEDEFKIISSRSGVRNNLIFRQLAKSTSPFGFYYKTFRRLERFVVEGIQWDRVTEKNFSRLEASVKEPNWTEDREQYRLDELTRNKQALSIVERIIDTRKDDVVRLQINNEFISELIKEQTDKLRSELNSISKDLNNKDLSPELLSEFLNKINLSSLELEEFAAKINPYSPDLSAVDGLKRELEKKAKAISSQKDKLLEEQEARRLAEEEAERLAKELELEKEKYTYLKAARRSVSDDAEGLIHNIKFTSGKIKSNIDTVINKVRDKTIRDKELLRRLGTVRFNAEKALKISNLITRANFTTDKEKQLLDIPKFYEQYVGLYNEMFDSDQIDFEFECPEELKFESKKSVLDLSVIFDDLVSNAEKAGARKVKVQISKNNQGELELLFSDNGQGLEEQFLDNPEKIFELGITTTDGSGIGLYFARDTLKKMNSTIAFAGNNQALKGASFLIIFKG